MKGEKKVLFQGARVIDPASKLDEKRDVLVEKGIIAAVDKPGSFKGVSEATVVDLSERVLIPGLVDLHVHLREPGFEWKETIETGSQAAVAGGFTTLCCMPNTDPVNDNEEVTQYILQSAERAGLCRVLPIGAITVGQNGEALAPFQELVDAGCVAFSDDGKPVSDANVMRRALEYGLMFNAVFACHEEEKSLSQGFSAHEGVMSLRLGLKGMPGAAEDIMISRDIELARLTGGRIHCCHVSTARAVTLIRRAKEDGISITAEVSPHHLTLEESAIEDYNTLAKMSMPLRTQMDIEALTKGLEDGTIDCVASDHAPHEADSKNKEFVEASFGIIGLQTTVPLMLEKVARKELSLMRVIASLTSDAARCFNLQCGTFKVGRPADMTVLDLEKSYVFTEEMVRSKSKNTPFLNQKFKGAVVKTYLSGKEVFSDNS